MQLFAKSNSPITQTLGRDIVPFRLCRSPDSNPTCFKGYESGKTEEHLWGVCRGSVVIIVLLSWALESEPIAIMFF